MTTVTNGKATELITFTRGTLATVTDSDGKVKWAPHNLLLASEQFDASNWTKTTATVTANAVAAPNGTTTADKIVADNASAGIVGQIIAFSAGQTVTLGIFAKKELFNFIQFGFSTEAFPDSGRYAVFNLDTGAVGSASHSGLSPTITPVGNGWYLCTVTATADASASSSCAIIPRATDTMTGSDGNGTSGIYVWGAHLYRSDLGGMQANASAYPMYNPSTPKNLLGYSEDFSNAAWSKLGVSAFGSGSVANAIAAPNGSQTADKIVEDTGTSDHAVYQQITTAIANGSYTASVYLKAGERTTSKVSMSDLVTGSAEVTVNLAAGTIGTPSASGNWSAVTASIAAAGDGWYRVSITGKKNASGNTTATLSVFIGTSSYAGNGTSGIYLWGAQLSDSASLDAYVPSFGAAPSAAAYHGPRLDYRDGSALGLLVEEQRTNLLLRSEEFDVSANWTVGTTSVTANQTASPSGAVNADLITATSGGGGSYVYQSPTVSATKRYNVSVYAKAGTAGFLNITVYDGTDGNRIWYNLATGAVGSTALVGDGLTTVTTGTPVPAANGFYRCDVSFTTKSRTTMNVFLSFTDADNSLNVTNGRTGYLYGAQLEAGSFATSYIPTAAATVTRNADVASVGTSQFPYSATEGTLVVSGDFVGFDAAKQPTFVSLTDGIPNSTPSASWVNISQDTSNVVSARRSASTTATDITASNSQTVNVVRKIGVAFKQGGTDALSVNGGTVATQSGVAAAYTNNLLKIGAFDTASSPSVTDPFYLNGHIRQITYLPRQVSNSELQSRTA